MSGHTPGPWTANLEGGGAPQWGVLGAKLDRGSFHRRIAKIGSPRMYLNPTLDAENEANARLIAAAPELLEALKELVADSDDVDDGKLPSISAATLSRARSAVAKAEGRP